MKPLITTREWLFADNYMNVVCFIGKLALYFRVLQCSSGVSVTCWRCDAMRCKACNFIHRNIMFSNICRIHCGPVIVFERDSRISHKVKQHSHRRQMAKTKFSCKSWRLEHFINYKKNLDFDCFAHMLTQITINYRNFHLFAVLDYVRCVDAVVVCMLYI